jgi:GNAT superfamily N-acetyltransferase
MKIIEVTDPAAKKEFHDLPRRLYKDDPLWICPLDTAVEAIFDPLRNEKFTHGEAIRWILRDENGETTGRIAAFIDRKRSSACRQPTGGIGFFEVIEDQQTAFMLLDTAKAWLSEHGIEAIDGPISFGENFNDWGLLVDGFMQQGFGMTYNKRYYIDFLQAYGFRNYFEEYTFHRTIRDDNGNFEEFPERIKKVAEWLIKRPDYSFRHFEFRQTGRFINDMCTIYDQTWGNVKKDFSPLSPETLYNTLKGIRFFLDEELIWFAYYNNVPVGFFILLPDFNQILRHFRGKISLFGMIRVFWYKIFHEMQRMVSVAGGVVPSHHNKGVEAALFYKLYESFRHKPWFRELEVGWVGDYNNKMIRTCESLGAVRAKTHVTFRYMINPDLKFLREKEELDEDLRQP